MENNTNLPPSGNRKMFAAWIILGASLLVTMAIIIYDVYFWQKNKQEKSNDAEGKPAMDVGGKKGKNSYVAVRPKLKPQINLKKIQVKWETKLKRASQSCQEDEKCFLAGEILNSEPEYAGKPLYIEAIPTGLGGSSIRHFIIEKDGNGTEKNSYAEGELGEEDDVLIEGVSDIPREIAFPGSDYRLKNEIEPEYFFSDLKITRKVFNDEALGDIYLTDEGCLVAELPNHTALNFEFILPIISLEDNTLSVRFNDGKESRGDYPVIDWSCGGVCNSVNEAGAGFIASESELEVAGKASNGENIYRFKDANNKNLRNLYNDRRTMSYYDDNMEKLGKNKYSYAEFINENPIIFWKDPLGRWIEFVNRKFDLPPDTC